MYLELIEFTDMDNLPTYREQLLSDLHVAGTKHLALSVENIDHSVQQLKDKGVKLIQEVTTGAL